MCSLNIRNIAHICANRRKTSYHQNDCNNDKDLIYRYYNQKKRQDMAHLGKQIFLATLNEVSLCSDVRSAEIGRQLMRNAFTNTMSNDNVNKNDNYQCEFDNLQSMRNISQKRNKSNNNHFASTVDVNPKWMRHPNGLKFNVHPVTGKLGFFI